MLNGRPKVLVVDDTATVRMYVKTILGMERVDILEACNGAEALRQIDAAPPDVILLDINMPVMDGIECCRRIKGSPTTRHIPVIVVTARGDEDHVKSAKAAGCDAYLTKPIRKVELVAKLRHHLKEERQAAAGGEA